MRNRSRRNASSEKPAINPSPRDLSHKTPCVAIMQTGEGGRVQVCLACACRTGSMQARSETPQELRKIQAIGLFLIFFNGLAHRLRCTIAIGRGLCKIFRRLGATRTRIAKTTSILRFTQFGPQKCQRHRSRHTGARVAHTLRTSPPRTLIAPQRKPQGGTRGRLARPRFDEVFAQRDALALVVRFHRGTVEPVGQFGKPLVG